MPHSMSKGSKMAGKKPRRLVSTHLQIHVFKCDASPSADELHLLNHQRWLCSFYSANCQHVPCLSGLGRGLLSGSWLPSRAQHTPQWWAESPTTHSSLTDSCWPCLRKNKSPFTHFHASTYYFLTCITVSQTYRWMGNDLERCQICHCFVLQIKWQSTQPHSPIWRGDWQLSSSVCQVQSENRYMHHKTIILVK